MKVGFLYLKIGHLLSWKKTDQAISDIAQASKHLSYIY